VPTALNCSVQVRRATPSAATQEGGSAPIGSDPNYRGPALWEYIDESHVVKDTPRRRFVLHSTGERGR